MRGAHPNSRANLAAAPGGDRYAGKRALIAAIRNALETGLTANEVRAFFGLRPGQLLKDKHRARMAKVKAPLVYAAMVESMYEGAMGGGLEVGGFIERLRKTSGRGRLYPVAPLGVGPLRPDEVQHRIITAELLPGYAGQDFTGETLSTAGSGGGALAISPGNYHGFVGGAGVEEYFYIYERSAGYMRNDIRFTTAWDDGHETVFVERMMPPYLLVRGVALSENAVLVTNGRLSQGEAEIAQEQYPVLMAFTWGDWMEFDVKRLPEWVVWEAEVPLAWPSGRSVNPAAWLGCFPRRYMAEDSDRLGQHSRADVEWVTGGEWLQRFGANRGAYLSAGCIVPPLVVGNEGQRWAMTFAADFLSDVAAAHEGPPQGAPE